jgi:hypothetical protein
MSKESAFDFDAPCFTDFGADDDMYNPDEWFGSPFLLVLV